MVYTMYKRICLQHTEWIHHAWLRLSTSATSRFLVPGLLVVVVLCVLSTRHEGTLVKTVTTPAAAVGTTPAAAAVGTTPAAAAAFEQKKIQRGTTTRLTNPVLDMYLNLLEQSVTGSLYNDNIMRNSSTKTDFHIDELRLRGNDWPGEIGHTMVGHLRIRNIKETLLDVIATNVPGDFAEFGVWRGGSCIFAAGLFASMGITDRHVHVFDAFGKLDATTGGYGAHNEYLAVREIQVKFNFWKYGLLKDDQVFFHPGLFQETAPKFSMALQQSGRMLAVLRIDGNFYTSYFSVLESLYDAVSEKGYVIFDDIKSHVDVQKAWEDFKASRGLDITLTDIDDHSAYFKKP